MTKAITSGIEILRVGHALIQGKRGDAGGAPSKDSVFGVAVINDNVISFGGRRGGTLRYKTYKRADKEAVLEKFAFKLTGKDKGFAYDDLTDNAAAQAELLGADFAASIKTGYYKAMAAKKLDTRKTARKSAAK